MSPEERLRQLCSTIAAEQDFDELRVLLQQLEFTLGEYGLDLQNRAVFLTGSSVDSHHKKAS